MIKNFFQEKSAIVLLSLFVIRGYCQSPLYEDSIHEYQQHYINTLDVIEQGERKYIDFFPANSTYNLIGAFKRINDTMGFEMNTSSGMKKPYLVYGKVSFVIDGVGHSLFIYRSKTLMSLEDYKDYLFIPFTDATSGISTYGGGRYIDVSIQQIKEDSLRIDFNKAYNPYCAYTAGYNCPIPPKENFLKIPIYAGEKNYAKPYH